MKRRNRVLRRALVIATVLGALVALVPVQTIRWSGAFADAEHRLTFRDSTGKPVEGVMLKVRTQKGGESYFYPVDEYLPDQGPRSDANGELVFHHARHMIEYGGTDRLSLLGVELWTEDAPQYECVFLFRDKEVHRASFRALSAYVSPRAESATVTRTWTFPNWDRAKYLPTADESSEEHERRLFDGNRDGKIDRDERIALRLVDRGMESPWVREIQFRVIESTIVIPDQ